MEMYTVLTKTVRRLSSPVILEGTIHFSLNTIEKLLHFYSYSYLANERSV